MKKIIGILLIGLSSVFSTISFADESELYQPNFMMNIGKPRYERVKNIPGGGVETYSPLYYDDYGRGYGSETIQWFPDYQIEIIDYPPDRQGRIYRTERVSRKRNSESDFSPIIEVRFKGYIN